jgi:alpha-beta hydrolase superfamily lysophospholipase
MNGIFIKTNKSNKNRSPVIFVHGDYQNHTIFKEIEDYFIKRGHSTFNIDLPGHGLSKAKEMNLSKLLDEIISERKLKKPAVIGNSLGGLLAIDYAERKDASSIILINSPIFNLTQIYLDIDWNCKLSEYNLISEQLFESQALVDYSNVKNLSNDKITEFGIKITNPIGVKNNMNFYRDFYENQSIDIKTSTLLIASKNDFWIPEEHARKWVNENKNRKLEFIQEEHSALIQNPLLISKIIDNNYSFLFPDTV